MPARDSVSAAGSARGRVAFLTFTDGLRNARLAAGLSQRRVAEAVGISRSEVSRIENGRVSRITHELQGRLAAAVGLDLKLNLYASARRLRDEGQIKLMRAFRDRLGPDWRWRFEVPFADAHDQRGWDMGGRNVHTGFAIVVDAESRIWDAQAVLRRESTKRRDATPARLVLLVADTRANRDALAAAREDFVAEFPVGTRRALAALCRGVDPGADVLVLLELFERRRGPNHPVDQRATSTVTRE